ncbi:BTAD domain-containing putative transcriptional regulator [Actinacidiphila acidipaludis]|uniref:BTAD domain-containing putative transcriptional regulator n=1 Tax=Actinacidiphila acidipaludis TaxID=2873382 RepID=UPI003555C631
MAAGGRIVTTDTLVADLWPDPPAGAVGALRTFVAALRRALEPGRPPRTPPRVLVTEGPGYALRLPREAVDAHRFEDALTAARARPQAVAALSEALASWRGPAYADVTDSPWAQRERARLEELRLEAVEVRAGLVLECGQDAGLAAELGAHVLEHPWREPAWGLLARALYRQGRQADALATLRRARTMLGEQLGLDPGPDLARLETAILTRSPALDPPRPPAGRQPGGGAGPFPAADPAARPGTATGQQATPGNGEPLLPGAGLGPRTTVEVARSLALAGGDALVSSRWHRLAAIGAAARTGDAVLTARVIGAYDVPALWSRADDPAQSAAVVAAAERALTALGPGGPPGLRARLLATVAVESRPADLSDAARERAGQAAGQALALARELRAAGRGQAAGGGEDAGALAFALNGVFLQSFTRPGLAARRDEIGAEITAVAGRHRLPAFAILGHLVRLQSASALGDLERAAGFAAAAEELAADTEAPLVAVLTAWLRARVAAEGGVTAGGPSPAAAAAAYRAADAGLAAAGMPGLHRGLLPLALLGLALLHGRPAPADPALDWGPYRPWAEPLLRMAEGRTDAARAALAAVPDPPHDHLQEALWCLTAHAAVLLGERPAAARAVSALRPARTEIAGAASGMLTLGPVAGYLARAQACAAGTG